MSRDSEGFLSAFLIFAVLFGALFGLIAATIAMSFWRIVAGEDAPTGLFILVWFLAGVFFFAWPMQLYERSRALKKQKAIMRERIGDLDYEPSIWGFTKSSKRSAEKKMGDHLEIERQRAEQRRDDEPSTPGFKPKSSRPSAEQMMADHLEIERQRAEQQAEDNPSD